jgi:hypothetical protein
LTDNRLRWFGKNNHDEAAKEEQVGTTADQHEFGLVAESQEKD